MVELITQEEFQEKVLEAKGPVVVDFYSLHCMPCKKMDPVIEEVAEELADTVKIYKMEVNDNYALATACGVSSFPTCILFQDGELIYRVIGPRTKETFIQELEL